LRHAGVLLAGVARDVIARLRHAADCEKADRKIEDGNIIGWAADVFAVVGAQSD
jgi:hypothetical protein